MENNTIKRAFRHGFTLIELMIVIVILGILMGTILPRITGAQSKAQDVAAIADITLIGQAVEAYYSDYGSYPLTTTAVGTIACLDDTAGGVGAALSAYIKGGKIPTPKKDTTATGIIFGESTGCGKHYAYLKLVDGYAVGTILNDTPKMNFDMATSGCTAFIITSTSKDLNKCFAAPGAGKAYVIGS
jgi:type II secretion system protein G